MIKAFQVFTNDMLIAYQVFTNEANQATLDIKQLIERIRHDKDPADLLKNRQRPLFLRRNLAVQTLSRTTLSIACVHVVPPPLTKCITSVFDFSPPSAVRTFSS